MMRSTHTTPAAIVFAGIETFSCVAVTLVGAGNANGVVGGVTPVGAEHSLSHAVALAAKPEPVTVSVALSDEMIDWFSVSAHRGCREGAGAVTVARLLGSTRHDDEHDHDHAVARTTEVRLFPRMHVVVPLVLGLERHRPAKPTSPTFSPRGSAVHST
jgi:hypothetical protein